MRAPIAKRGKNWAPYNATGSPIDAFGGHLFLSCGLWSSGTENAKTHPDLKTARLSSFSYSDHVNVPDGIRAFYGVFREWPDWRSGHFTRRSGFRSSAGSCTLHRGNGGYGESLQWELGYTGDRDLLGPGREIFLEKFSEKFLKIFLARENFFRNFFRNFFEKLSGNILKTKIAFQICDAPRAKGLATFALLTYLYENFRTGRCPARARQAPERLHAKRGGGGILLDKFQ